MGVQWTDTQWDSIVDLLTYVAAADRRTVGETDVRVWLDAARDGEWPSIDFAYVAVVKHRNNRPDTWLQPGHITQTWRAIERAAQASFKTKHLEIPQAAADDPTEYRRWIREEAAQHRAALLAGFVQGEQPTLAAIEAAA